MTALPMNILQAYYSRARVSFARWDAHMRRRWFWYALPVVTLLVLHQFYMLGANVTYSLPGDYYVIERGVAPASGDITAFYWQGGGPYAAGTMFLKRVAGVAGDEISVQGREVFVNGKLVGTAKETSRAGKPLAIITPGKIPEGYLYVQADHKDSLDSRYALTGLINVKQLIGRAHVIY